MKRIRNTIKSLLLLGAVGMMAACSDTVSDTPQPSDEPWTVSVGRSATGGADLLVVLDNDGTEKKGQLHPAETEGGTATWIGQGLDWPASGTVKLTTFCPYPPDGSLPGSVSSDDNTAYQVDYAETDADNKVTGFILKHLMAQLRVHIKVAENDTHPVPTDAVIRLCTKATVDYPNCALTDAADARNVDLGTFAKEEGYTDGDDNWVNTAQIIVPQTLVAGERCIDFTAGGQEFHFTPDCDIVLEAGCLTHIYLGVAMNQSDVQLTLEDVTVDDWNEQEIVGGEAVEWVNGFSETGEYEPAQQNASGYYEIKNGGNLFWFANHVNTVDRAANAVLTAAIDLEGRPWTPIGSIDEENNNFRGVFDGQNYTIWGLHVEGSRAGLGFFGAVRTGTVKNFTIYGEVVVNTEVDYVGGVIGSICGLNSTDHGLERNGAVIQNITSYVNLTAKAHGIGMIGGFVGHANHQSLIEKCSWYGTFDAGEYHVDSGAGGFIGKIQESSSEVTIRNCAAYGTIKTNYAKDSFNNTPTIYMGGFLSFSNTDAETVLENCLFAGKFEKGSNLTDQARLGAFGMLRSVNAIKNCYYLADDGLAAVHSDSPLNANSVNVKITAVTEDDLRNNTIATLLGEYWTQGENYPVIIR